jgi:hypothetical protein
MNAWRTAPAALTACDGHCRPLSFTIVRAALLCLSLALSACASKQAPRPPLPGQEAAPWPGSDEFQNQFGDVIPAVLLRAMGDAYARPEPLTCEALIVELQVLESVLREDLDSRSGEPDDPNLLTGAVVGAVKGMIPYRSALMQLSGESERARRGVAAIVAGNIRRAYLKGLGEALGCALPATPKRPPKPAAVMDTPAGHDGNH